MSQSMMTEERIGTLDTPSPARIYDHFLGGSHNFPVDRQAAGQLQALYPDAPLIMRANRAFLRRVVRYLVAQGIDQFLDIGSGLQTVGSVHEVAHRENPTTRIVYVDSDPIAVQQSLEVLKETPSATVIQADARDPAAILADPEVQRLLDLDRPIGLLLVALLHFVPDDVQAYCLVRTLCDAMSPGSYLVISHGTDEGLSAERLAPAGQLYDTAVHPIKMRTRAEVLPFFDGLELVEPGLVYVPLWHPDEPGGLFLGEPSRSGNISGVARKP